MKFNYYPATDSLYIHFAQGRGANNVMINDDVVADLDADGNLIGLDIQHASLHTDLKQFMLEVTSPAFSIAQQA